MAPSANIELKTNSKKGEFSVLINDELVFSKLDNNNTLISEEELIELCKPFFKE